MTVKTQDDEAVSDLTRLIDRAQRQADQTEKALAKANELQERSRRALNVAKWLVISSAVLLLLLLGKMSTIAVPIGE